MFSYAGCRLGDRREQVQQYLQPAGHAVTAALLTGLVLLVESQPRRPTA